MNLYHKLLELTQDIRAIVNHGGSDLSRKEREDMYDNIYTLEQSLRVLEKYTVDN